MDSCVVCGHTPVATDAVVRLVTPDGGHVLHLCEECLERREVAHWTGVIGGEEVERALRRRRSPERFTYLHDETGDVHLVRLRDAWVRGHARAVLRPDTRGPTGPSPRL